MFEVPLKGGSPSLLGPRPNDDLGGEFWLSEGQLLFPAGFATPLIEDQLAVLFGTDRNAGSPKVLVSIPNPPSIEWQYDVSDVQVVGDDVYWLARDRHTDSPSDLVPEWETTHVLRRSSWRTPGTPEDLYSSEHAFDGLVIAGKLAFVKQELEPKSYEYEQRIVDLETKAALDESAEAKFGGAVVAGDAESLFVSVLQLEPPYESGVFRVAPDGSGRALVSENSFSRDFVREGDGWVFTDGQTLTDPTLVFSYRVGEEPKQIGCIEKSGTSYALTATSGKAYLGLFRDNTTTILEYAR
jgi:hypothetical protein